MKEIHVEGFSFLYSTELDVRKAKLPFQIGISYNAVEYIDKSELLELCRLSVYLLPFKNTTYLGEYLFWFKKVDLHEIDNKVDQDRYTDKDFEFSIRSYFINHLTCFVCNSVFKGLVIDNTSYWYHKGVMQAKLDSLKQSNGFKTCPKCGSNFRIVVVHIFE